MSLVIAEGLFLSYGKKVILDDAAFTLGPTDRVGLVGANGTGKSTLLKILAGQLTPDAGQVRFSRRARPGYLPQEIAGLPEGNLVDAVLSAVPCSQRETWWRVTPMCFANWAPDQPRYSRRKRTSAGRSRLRVLTMDIAIAR